MDFVEYIWNLAHIVFKRKWEKTSDIYKTFNVIGVSLGKAKQEIFKLRENKLILTSKGISLDYHGKDRKMPRYTNESDDEYRNRLLAAAYYYSLGGTIPGMLLGLEKLGYTAEIYELFKEKYALNPNYVGRWAEFIIKLKDVTDLPIQEHNLAILKSVINKIKPARTKLYCIQYLMPINTALNLDNQDQVLKIGQRFTTAVRGTPVKLDGSHKLDGTWKLDSMAISHELKIKTLKNGVLLDTLIC